VFLIVIPLKRHGSSPARFPCQRVLYEYPDRRDRYPSVAFLESEKGSPSRGNKKDPAGNQLRPSKTSLLWSLVPVVVMIMVVIIPVTVRVRTLALLEAGALVPTSTSFRYGLPFAPLF